MLWKFPDVPTGVCFHYIFHLMIITFPFEILFMRAHKALFMLLLVVAVL